MLSAARKPSRARSDRPPGGPGSPDGPAGQAGTGVPHVVSGRAGFRRRRGGAADGAGRRSRRPAGENRQGRGVSTGAFGSMFSESTRDGRRRGLCRGGNPRQPGARRAAAASRRVDGCGGICRVPGDARAADGYLRQVGHPLSVALRAALGRLLVPPKTAIARNAPCPLRTHRAAPGSRPGTAGWQAVLPQGPAVLFVRPPSHLFIGRILQDGTRPRLLALPVQVDRDQRIELLDLLERRPSAQELAEFVAPRPEP